MTRKEILRILKLLQGCERCSENTDLASRKRMQHYAQYMSCSLIKFFFSLFCPEGIENFALDLKNVTVNNFAAYKHG